MIDVAPPISSTRRRFLSTTAGLGSLMFFLPLKSRADEPVDDPFVLIQQLTGKTPVETERLHLEMPAVFPNGYTVPLSVAFDSPMTEADHVKNIRVFAPQNPLIEVAAFYFTPEISVPRVSTRIRLAGPQYVLAVAEMNDGALLLAKSWVSVSTNGCK